MKRSYYNPNNMQINEGKALFVSKENDNIIIVAMTTDSLTVYMQNKYKNDQGIWLNILFYNIAKLQNVS